MKITRRILIIAFLLCIFTYICKIDSIPKNLILYKGELLNIGNFFGISMQVDGKDIKTVLASSNINEEKNLKQTADIKLFDAFSVKKVDINIIDETKVIPVGQVSGLKLYTNGVLVVGMSEIKAEDGKKYKPYENTGIKEGDRIVKINEKNVIDTENLIKLVNESNGNELKVEYESQGETKYANITPIKYVDDNFKLGLWVRDSAAGIGTLSFYEPKSRKLCSFRTPE